MSDSATDTLKVVLKRSGDLTIKEDGQDTIIAHYEQKSGYLEFTTKENSVRFYNQVTTRLGTVSNGTLPSTNVIRSIGIKGERRPDMANAPKRPRMGPLGDAGEEVVQWYLTYDLPQAIVRYGIYCDDKGQPIKKKVRRVLESTSDLRESHTDDEIDAVKDGPGTKSKAPVKRERELIEKDDGIIARRATALTFVPQEVVGGWQPDDDFEEGRMAVQEGEA